MTREMEDMDKRNKEGTAEENLDVAVRNMLFSDNAPDYEFWRERKRERKCKKDWGGSIQEIWIGKSESCFAIPNKNLNPEMAAHMGSENMSSPNLC